MKSPQTIEAKLFELNNKLHELNLQYPTCDDLNDMEALYGQSSAIVAQIQIINWILTNE